MNKKERLIKQFLTAYKELFEQETGQKFHPRHLVMIFQNDLRSNEFNWTAYHSWFDKMQCNTAIGTNLFEILLDNGMHVLIEEEEIRKKSMLSKADEKKLIKALNLLRDIKVDYKK